MIKPLSLRPKLVENTATIEGHNGAIYDVFYLDEHLFTTSADKYVVKWDIKEAKQTNLAIKLEESAYQIDHNPKNNHLVIGTNKGAMHVVDLTAREEIRLITHHSSSIFALHFNHAQNHLYTGDREGNFCVWDAETYDLLLDLPFGSGKMRDIAVSENGDFAALCGEDGYIRVLETGFYNQVSEYKAHTESANCALFDGDFLISGGKDAYVRKWNWREQKLVKEIPGHNYAVYDLEFFKDKKRMVTVSFDKTIKIWDAESLEVLERIEFQNGGHRHTVNRIAKISEDKFVTVGDDRKIKIWEFQEVE